VDLREGHVVQLVGGDYANEAVRLDDPREIARRWVHVGFSRLHVVDLDAATGRGDNRGVIRDLLFDAAAPIQVGGGIRTTSLAHDLLDDGAGWIVVGTRAIEDGDWIEELAQACPGRVIVAADVRERKVVTRGWADTSQRSIVDVVEDLAHLPLAGILVTAVHKEGQLQGTDLPLMEDVAEAAACLVIASGGITTMADLRALEDRGVGAAVLGMALYTGALDPRIVAEEFAE
jgi:phosphoribosylformimino-5-aminoimidazole carboxamide ribotide isomerase